jgi:hypothetical protein
MGRYRHATAGAAAGLALTAGLAAAGAAHAGSSTTSTSSNGGCGCVPTSHQVRVPGIAVTAPSVTVYLPTLNVVSADSSASANAAANANAATNVNTNVSVSGSASSGINTQAIINADAFGTSGGGGGGGSWSDSGSVTTTIESVKVDTPSETRRICALYTSQAQMIAVQANCLDDKDIPHPASQLSPARDVDAGYEGEVYRCIAGARMQYTIADFNGPNLNGSANFGHGQTFTCQKGEALYHAAGGGLQCRAQKPARDCNERSLLRRFGAGIKVLKIERNGVCAQWRTETVQASN